MNVSHHSNYELKGSKVSTLGRDWALIKRFYLSFQFRNIKWSHFSFRWDVALRRWEKCWLAFWFVAGRRVKLTFSVLWNPMLIRRSEMKKMKYFFPCEYFVGVQVLNYQWINSFFERSFSGCWRKRIMDALLQNLYRFNDFGVDNLFFINFEHLLAEKTVVYSSHHYISVAILL